MRVITAANQITLLRMLLVPAFVTLVVDERFGWALIVFMLAGLTDLLDGLIARWSGQQSSLGAWLDPMADKLLAQTGSTIDERGRRCYRYLMGQPAHDRGVLQMMAAWDLDALRSRLPLLRLPVQLQIGLNDGTVPPRLADEVCSVLPHAQRIDWPGRGHLAHEEDPQGCAQAILSFVTHSPAGSSSG